MTQETDCPNGSHPSFVRAVSAVYREGISTTMMAGPTGAWTYDGERFGTVAGYANLSGTSRTALSQWLAPPVEPVYENPYGNGTKAFFAICVTFVWVYLIPLPIMWWVNRGKSKEAAERHAIVGHYHPLWMAAMDRWNRAYYCSKCDGVFLPGQTQLTPVDVAQKTVFSM